MVMKRIAFLMIAAPLVAAAEAPAAELAAESSTAPRRVRVAAVETTTARSELRFPGRLRSAERARLAFAVGARLAERRVEAGQRVAAGALVARLDARELRHAAAAADADVAEVEARLAQLTSELARVEKLHAVAAATDEELERARSASDALVARRRAGESRLEDARRRLGEAELRAPFAGTVTEVLLEPGEMAAPGQTVVVLSGDGALEVEIGVPEGVVARIEAGRPAMVHLPLAGRVIAGTIRRVGGAASGALFPVLVTIDDATGLAAGMSAEVAVELVEEEALTVPLAAILDPGGGAPAVFRVTGERVERVLVEVRSLVGERVSVAGDLQPGDRVVVAGHPSLVDGDRVEVRP